MPLAPGRGGGAGAEGAGRGHLGGGEGSRQPDDTAPGGGLRGALLGGWAKPSACGCGGLAASGGGNLAATTNLASHPCPPVPVDACSWPFSGCGHCGDSAARGCPCSYAASCRGAPIGGAGWRPEAPGLRWAGAGGGHGEGRVVGSPPRPRR